MSGPSTRFVKAYAVWMELEYYGEKDLWMKDYHAKLRDESVRSSGILRLENHIKAEKMMVFVNQAVMELNNVFVYRLH